MNPSSTPSLLLTGIGQNVATYRKAAGITQADLAARIAKSVQWISAIECGRRYCDRLTDLIAISQVLSCELEALVGQPIDMLSAPGGKARRDVAGEVRDVILKAAVPVATTIPAPTLLAMNERIAAGWDSWHRSPTSHTTVGALLPRLLTDASSCYQQHDGPDRRLVAAMLSAAWQLARQWLHHIADEAMAWVAGERAMTAARESEDPRMVALSAWALSASYRRNGHQPESTRLLIDAADELYRRVGDNPTPGEMAAYGMLHLTAAISAAQEDNDGKAWSLHIEAERMAAQLGGYVDPWTKFGPLNVGIHGVAMYAELGRPGDVIEYANRLNTDAMDSVERRATHQITTARGYVRTGDHAAAALVLLAAEKISPEEVRDSILVMEMLREMLAHDRQTSREQVRRLAQRTGLIAAA